MTAPTPEVTDLVRGALSQSLMLQTAVEMGSWDAVHGVVSNSLAGHLGRLSVRRGGPMPRSADELARIMAQALEPVMSSVLLDVVGYVAALSLAVVRLAEVERCSTVEVADRLIKFLEGPR